MKRQRFVAPARGDVPRACFDHPIFAGFARHAAWLHAAEWPSLDDLNRAMPDGLRFVEQTRALLEDGLHYETRIRERGEIATRAGNWHDLFNALMWIERRPLKAALNARQADDVRRAGLQRTRAQCAQTHFDEAGAIVVLRDEALLAAWDAHDWRTLFFERAQAWRNGDARVIVFGHALLEHALQPSPVHTAKCIAAISSASDEAVVAAVARTIEAGALLTDPQELRPLPLSGIPGWHPRTSDPAFYADAPCFRPLRPGRVYPPPLRVAS